MRWIGRFRMVVIGWKRIFTFVYGGEREYTELLAFIPIFPLHFKKNIYLCNTLSAHQRGETCGKRFLFFREYVKFHLSESKFSDFTKERWCGRYSTRTAYINISVTDVLYINDWRGCLLSSLSFGRVSLALILDNGATAFTSFLYPAGLFAPKT